MMDKVLRYPRPWGWHLSRVHVSIPKPIGKGEGVPISQAFTKGLTFLELEVLIPTIGLHKSSDSVKPRVSSSEAKQ